MPIYEFYCEKCDFNFDEITKMGTEEFVCKKCGKVCKKSSGSFLSSAHGLPNGHIGARTSKDVVNKKLDTALQNFK